MSVLAFAATVLQQTLAGASDSRWVVRRVAYEARKGNAISGTAEEAADTSGSYSLCR